jgi:hypothetical protein
MKIGDDRGHIWVAFLFLFLQILVGVRNVYSDYMLFFWFCDFAPAVFFIAFLMKRYQLVKGMINIIFFPQVVFLMIFLTRTVLHYTGMVTFGYDLFFVTVTIMFHLASIIAMIFTYKITTNENSLAYSLLLLSGTFLVGLAFTPAEGNINFIYTLGNAFGIPELDILWIPITFFIVVLPTYYLQKVLYKRKAFRRGRGSG